MAWTAPRTWTAGQVVTAAQMNTHVRDNLTAGFTSEMFQNTTWNCSVRTTGSTGPNGQSLAGDYVRVGPLVSAWGRTNLAATTAFGTAGAYYYLSLPKNLASYVPTGVGGGACVGSGVYYDDSAKDNYMLSLIAYTTNKFVFRFDNVGTTDLGLVSSTSPVDIAVDDRFHFHLSYPTTST